MRFKFNKLSKSIALISLATSASVVLAAEPRPAPPVEEILVSATKRETNLQDTPIAISVVNDKMIAERHITGLMDFQDGAVPSLRVATFEARRSALTIGVRGIVPLDANQPAREQGVGVYIDGIYLARQHGLDGALLDLQRIEVLKGPQGTLFGRNTEGGALSMISKKPTGEFDLRTVTGIGNYGAYNTEMHLDMPKVGDFSFKVDGALQNRDATVSNPMPGQTGWNSFNRKGIRLSTRWEPVDDFTADFSYDNSHDEDSPFYSQLVNYNPLGKTVGIGSGLIAPLPAAVQVHTDRQTVADIGVPQQPSVGAQTGGSLNLKWTLSKELELRSITGYRDLAQSQWDNSGGAHRTPAYAPNGKFSRYSLSDLWQHQFSQEFQAVGNIENLDYVGGVYYFEEEAREEAATPSSMQWNATGTDYTVLDPRVTYPGLRSIDRGSMANSKSSAVYGQGTYTPDMMQALHVTVGGRYTMDEKNGKLYTVNNAPTNFTFDQSTNRFNPMVTIAYDASRDLNLYVKYSTSYRSGGASSRSLTFKSFGPESVKSYEFGAKADLLDGKANVNFAAYTMDRTGSQIDFSVPIGSIVNGVVSNRNTLETINAPGTTKIKGIELDASIKPIEGLKLTAAYAYTDTSVPNTINPFTNVSQPVFIVFTPKNAASASADYTMPMSSYELVLHVDANYSDGVHSFDQQAVMTDSSFLVNGRISAGEISLGKTGGKLNLSLWARNLLDKSFIYRLSGENDGALGSYANFNEPRTFGVEARMEF